MSAKHWLHNHSSLVHAAWLQCMSFLQRGMSRPEAMLWRKNDVRFFDKYAKPAVHNFLKEFWKERENSYRSVVYRVALVTFLINGNDFGNFMACGTVPVFKNRPRFKQPWMTKGLLKSSKRKANLYLKYIKKPTPVNKAKFVTYLSFLLHATQLVIEVRFTTHTWSTL